MAARRPRDSNVGPVVANAVPAPSFYGPRQRTDFGDWCSNRVSLGRSGLGSAGAWPRRVDLKLEFSLPFFSWGDVHGPDHQNLRALVNAFETLVRLGNRFDGGDPALGRCGSLYGGSNVLPFVDEAELSAGQAGRRDRACPVQRMMAGRSFEITVGLVRREKIHDQFDPDLPAQARAAVDAEPG